MKKFKFLVCGGTFDLLHKGHKKFIDKALESAEKVLIGITSDEYVKTFKNGNEIQSFSVRKKAVEDYLNSIGVIEKTQLILINNAYEPYIQTSADYDAIAVTKQTQQIAVEINSQRKQNGVLGLEVIIVPMVLAEDGLEISSTRIRNGEINRDGKLYLNPKWKNKTLILPDNLRSVLQNPWGEVLSEIPKGIDGKKTVVVGDATALNFNQQKINQLLSIVDFLIRREVKFQNLSQVGFKNETVQKVKSSRGTITPELFFAIQKAFEDNDKKVILIEGEDDLSALAVLLISPLGFSVFYGQPNEGLVEIKVTEENKEKAYQLINNFELI